MADIKISQLPAATTPLAGTEVLPLVQSGETKKVTVADLRATAVTAVTGTAPVVSSGGLTPAISMAAASTSANGYLTSTDWNTFNGKGSGTVTGVTATSPVVSSGGTAPVISMPAASTSASGYLTSTDWNTFNGKYSTGGALGTPSSGTATNLTGLPLTTGVTGTLPVANGGTGVTTSTGTGATVLSTSPTLVTPLLGTPTSGVATNLTGLPLTTGVTGVLPVANGGNGTATPSLVAGTNVTVTGTWPNQTVNATASGSGTVTSVAVSGGTTGLTTSGGPITTSGTITLAGTLAVANGGTGTTTPALVAGTNVTISGTWPNQTINSSGGGGMTYPGAGIPLSTGTAWGTSYNTTGTGNVVLSTSPTLVTPLLGTPTSGVATNLTGLPLTTGVTGTLPVANGGTGVTTSTGTGNVVLSTSPTLVTPLLGTPTSATLTNATGLPLTTGVTGLLPVANGGTGTATPALVAGTNVTISGTWPNQTINSSGSGGVTTFSAGTTGFTPSTATSGAVTLAGTLATTNGGTGLTSFTANQVFYASSTSAFAQSPNLQYSGTDLTVYGITVGRGAGAVSTNTAVGASALAANTSASNNTAFGNASLASTSTGSANTALGSYALNATTGGSNTGVGFSALIANTSGASNVSVGYQSLAANTTASNNTAVGYQAAYSNTAANVSAFGAGALYTNTTGTLNTAIGQQSLNKNTTGSSNSASGVNALYANTTGSSNTAVGDSALTSNTTASNNTAVGYQAGYSNTTGIESVYIGQNAGYSGTTNGQNTFVGRYAGYSNTGNYNAFFGYGAGNAITSGTKNTIIGRYDGNNGGLDIRTASNYIVLSDGDGNPRGIFDSSGNLLVGQTSTSKTNNGVQIYSASGNNGRIDLSKTASGLYSAIANYYNGTYVGGVDYSNSATSFPTSSDVRLKKDVVDAPSASAKIDQIRIVSHGWKHDDATVEFGVIAQELYDIAPEAVSKGDDSETVEKTWGVDYSKLVPMLVKEIQSLRKRLADAGL
jgi:hypothetical protein